jgi:L-cystine uptake protein TcyP (sodium:dicarboxylate symporter family)
MSVEVYQVAIIPLIVGVVELFKSLGLPKKFSALTAALLGILIGLFYVYPRDIPRGILVGLSYGLAASGLYSGTKNTVQGVKEMRVAGKK